MMRRLMRKVNSSDESGIALVTVIAVGAVLTMLVVAGVAFSLGGFKKSRSDENWNGALAAAYAGVEEYQSRLAANPAYVRFGNALSTYTSYVNPSNSADKSGLSKVSTPVIANPAFGVGASGTWAKVPGSDDAYYRYEVNNSRYDIEGTLTIRVTGRVGDQTRSIVADLKQDGFVNYVYFTDLETADPYDVNSSCYLHAWEGRPSGCGDILFRPTDVIDGAVHSNDTMVICEAEFKKQVTTEYNPSNTYYKNGTKTVGGRTVACGAPKLNGLTIKFSEHIQMPPTNNDLRKETRYDLTATDVPLPGCLYTGPTSIVFKDNGTMVVKSPWTKATQISGAPARAGRSLDPATNTYPCGNPTQLKSSAGATVNVPNNNAIFVQTVPTDSQDPNYTARASAPSPVACDGKYTGSGRNRVWNKPNNGIGYPVADENWASESPPSGTKAYDCQAGDLFVEGKVDGKVTVAAENYIYVVNDLSYESTTDDDNGDLLGLVGQSAVIVWNPVSTSNSCLSTYCDYNRVIQAAILSVAHTFTVQNYNVIGDRGELRVLGSIAQKFRGIVAQSGGYVKAYKYDVRFVDKAPPKFLAPASTTYGVTTWVEINPVFKANGSY